MQNTVKNAQTNRLRMDRQTWVEFKIVIKISLKEIIQRLKFSWKMAGSKKLIMFSKKKLSLPLGKMYF